MLTSTARQREDAARQLFRRVPGLEATRIALSRQLLALVTIGTAGLAMYAIGVYGGFRASAISQGQLIETGLRAPVTIARDDRDVPHIVARSDRDLFFAQGFVQASDRLFQMELTRRYALGTLAEVLGPRALAMDEEQRYFDVHDLAEREWRALGLRERAGLIAFSDGVNAAMRQQPLPVEFRLLLYRPQPWRPQDCLAVSLAVSIALSDSWRDVLLRNQTWQEVGPRGFDARFPLTDPRYDVSIAGKLVSPRSADVARTVDPWQRIARAPASLVLPKAGSNAWAAGGSHTYSGRALLANDPHLDLTIPGLWYLQDLRAPGIHVAGASIPGDPGVLLGHNERVAWGATNADASTMSVFAGSQFDRRAWVTEVFRVRFSKDAHRAYYRTRHAFGVPDLNGRRTLLVRWPLYDASAAAVTTFLALDRARTVREAQHVLASYGGTPENFLLADTAGRVAYHVAGTVPNDPAWGRYVHAARDVAHAYPPIAFAALPALAPSRATIAVSANNKMYARGYPYRLAAAFEPPYRAYRIAELLRQRRSYDDAYFAAMQLDTVSPIDREFARRLIDFARRDVNDGPIPPAVHALQAWSGDFSSSSQSATLVHALRARLEADTTSPYSLLTALRGHGDRAQAVTEELEALLYEASGRQQTWGEAGAVRIEHPLAPLHFGFLDGATLPGAGDEYTIHLQQPGFSQSFRAVWDVGNWDGGGIVIPSGESGEPGSGHYSDLSATWISGRLCPLPFSEVAVARATRAVLELTPR